jgi:hypothetical protein
MAYLDASPTIAVWSEKELMPTKSKTVSDCRSCYLFIVDLAIATPVTSCSFHLITPSCEQP